MTVGQLSTLAGRRGGSARNAPEWRGAAAREPDVLRRRPPAQPQNSASVARVSSLSGFVYSATTLK